VSELVLEVVDLERAIRFYAEDLGLPLVERWDDREAAWVMIGDRTRLGLWRPQVGLARGRGGVHVHVAMHVDDAGYDELVTRLREHGHEVEEHVFDTYKRSRAGLRHRPRRQRCRTLDLGRGKPSPHVPGPSRARPAEPGSAER
jgi:catechol 2,3-dioxygenase-like lactoylglutathione lyase family enzyme